MRAVTRVTAIWALLSIASLQAGCSEKPAPASASQASSSSQSQAASPQATLNAAPDSTADAPAAGAPAASAIAPGAYATEQGWGQLSLKADAAGAVLFSLETENSGAGCSLSGKVSGSRATAYDGATASGCVLDLTAKPGAIAIASRTTEACRAYCGGNGSYEGDYLRLGDACAPAAVQKARDDFKALYDKRSYAAAAAALAPVYDTCLPTLALVDEGGVRNDYALTRHKLGDDAACRAALDKYRDDIGRSDDAISDGMAPAIVDDYLAVIGAARTNARLCGDKPAH